MKLKIRDITTLAVLSAIMIVGQVALAGIPNVEVVSLLVIIYTLFYKKKALYIIYTFVLVEGLIYGFGVWWICYLYVWTVLWGITLLMRKEKNVFVWALMSGIYGLCFGTLCSIPYFFIGGPSMALSWIASGLTFDLIHGVGNLAVALALFAPLRMIFTRLQSMNMGFGE